MLENYSETIFINDIGPDKKDYNNIAFAKFNEFKEVVGVSIR